MTSGRIRDSLGGITTGLAALTGERVRRVRAPASQRRGLVTVVSRVFHPESAAAAFRLTAVVAALARSEHRVRVITSAFPPGASGTAAGREVGQTGSQQTGVQVRRRPVRRDADGYVRGYLPYLSFDLPLAVRLAVSPRPDAVLVEPPPTTGAVVRVITGCRSALRRLPYVYYAADIWSDATASTGAPAWVVAALRWVERFALRGAAGVIAVSEGVAARARELGAENVEVISNGVDTSVFTPMDDPATADLIGRDLPAGPFILYAGTASEWQGAEIFAEAMPRVLQLVPNASLVYLGQGSSWARIRQIADTLPAGAIRQLPLVPAEAAAAWHRAASVAAVSVRPGIGYDFAYPTKVLAALACGADVVFAGPGPAGADLRRTGLGVAVDYDLDAVTEALIGALIRPEDPSTVQRRAGWVQAHKSLARTGELAAAFVERVVRAQQRAVGEAETLRH